jgi:hypothetical protein
MLQRACLLTAALAHRGVQRIAETEFQELLEFLLAGPS